MPLEKLQQIQTCSSISNSSSHILFHDMLCYHIVITKKKKKEELTLTRRLMECSRKMEMKMKKKQTVASAHVGVYSRVAPPDPESTAMTALISSQLDVIVLV